MSHSSTSSDNDMEYISSGDELGLLELFEERDRPKNENYFEHTIPRYNDSEFVEHFRVSRHVAESVSQQFEISQYFHYQSGRHGKLGSFQQIIIFLWFAGHQTSSFRDVADRFDISISSLFKIIRKITYFLSNLSQHIISWPTPAEKNEIERNFRENGFPGVIGVIDGSHIKIDKPSNDPDSYLNRKHFHSIQLQVVCDHQRRIRDIFVGFPGSVHDSRVFRVSPLANTLQEKCQDHYILGDSGYPCLRNLLTPFADRGQLTRRQRNFNTKLSKSRYVVEHCFGLLKQKFRQLYHIKLRSIPDVVHFIRACCVLHNMALTDDFHLQDPDHENDHGHEQEHEGENYAEDDDDDGNRNDRNGIEMRNYVANILPL
ncbi:putative nuclease HARBI1 [Periplaneta americana]|uniref:DDE Tnp4 domain-containing protein n=1 Tax=Periplaneta americana TaxID=6978 RepID=A0ABQ8SVX5_PERAM|nr:hypothetical protein ANN_13735 [Periplaneta americana]